MGGTGPRCACPLAVKRCRASLAPAEEGCPPARIAAAGLDLRGTCGRGYFSGYKRRWWGLTAPYRLTPCEGDGRICRLNPTVVQENCSPEEMMKTPVTITLTEERHAVCGGDATSLPAGVTFVGDLTLTPSDGPLGIREYDHPHFLVATLDFTLVGLALRYTGFISQWDLWAPTGTQVQIECPGFEDQTGQIDGMMDDRDDWSYVLPDGTTHANRLKYTSCKFWVMPQASSLLVRCEYYDQNPDITRMVTIFYTRSLEDLLLLKDTKVFHDADGNPEDFDLHGGDTITLKPRCEHTPAGDVLKAAPEA